VERNGELTPCHCNQCRAQWIQKQTGLYGELLKWRLKDTANEANLQMICALAEKFVESPEGWLAFWGPYGGGKTWFLVGIIHECLRQGIKARYIEAENLLQEWRASFSQDDISFDTLFNKMTSMPVLTLDELDKIRPGRGGGSDWASTQLIRILHHRHNLRNGTVFGLNSNPENWMRSSGLGSVLDRLLDDRNYGIIYIGGLSRRKGKK